MKALAKILDRVWAALENGERARRDDWLAQSTDIHELEQRIRQLERDGMRSRW